MKDSRQRFSEAAEAYALYRPSYPPDLVHWVARGVPRGAKVADVGCGTGITSRRFAAEGYRVVGIDPNEAMLAKARVSGGLFVRGEATATGLADGIVDLVIAGQAFHWFTSASALGEFGRILKPRGPCAVFWNERGSSPLMDAYEDLLVRSSREYRSIPRPRASLEFLRGSPLVRDLEEQTFAHTQSMDQEAFRGRVYSSSYVVHGVADREAFDRELSEIFDRHASGGRVAFLYETLGAVFRIRSGGEASDAAREGRGSAPGPARG